jgi:hypothetical protein
MEILDKKNLDECHYVHGMNLCPWFGLCSSALFAPYWTLLSKKKTWRFRPESIHYLHEHELNIASWHAVVGGAYAQQTTGHLFFFWHWVSGWIILTFQVLPAPVAWAHFPVDAFCVFNYIIAFHFSEHKLILSIQSVMLLNAMTASGC